MCHTGRWLALLLVLFYSLGVAFSSERLVRFKVATPEVTVGQTRNFLTVDLSSSLAEIDAKFLSLTLGSKHIVTDWQNIDQQVKSAAAGLAPADIRLGGTSANFLTFQPRPARRPEQENDQWDSSEDSYELDSGLVSGTKHVDNVTLTPYLWKSFNNFITAAGWSLLFDANVFRWRSDGLWDSSNLKQLLDFSAAQGIKIPFFQLGNEPNSYKHNFNLTIPADKLVKYYWILKNLTSKYPLYAQSTFCGPDVTDVARSRNANEYVRLFLSSGGADVVQELSLHHYYLNGRTGTVQDFLSRNTLDSFKHFLQVATGLAKLAAPPLPVQLTETSSCFGGGCPSGLSNGYVAGFLWLDKLGLSAQFGLTRVFRQDFMGASYALMTPTNGPTPDFYLSLLFKRLVAGPVLNVTLAKSNDKLRVYANCARPSSLYPAGALVLYYLNLDTDSAHLSLPQLADANLELYLLTPGDNSGLTSNSVRLNGKLLKMTRSSLPNLTPRAHKGHVVVRGQTFGFLVVPQAKVQLCQNYWKSVAETSTLGKM